MAKKSRPIGVTLLAILYGFAGAMIILMGLFVLVVTQGITVSDFVDPADQVVYEFVESMLGILGIVIIVTGLLVFLWGYGLWKLNFFTWIITVLFSGLTTIGITLNILSTGIINLANTPILTIIIFVYFIMVRDAFRQ